MPIYEYKVVPAPTKGLKAKGLKTPEARFSNAIQALMNEFAGDGWEYQRAETLPSVERAGLTSTTTEWRNLLVFRRPRQNDPEAFKPELLPAPAPVSPTIDTPPPAKPDSDSAGSDDKAKATDAALDEAKAEDAAKPEPAESEPENGVEDTEDAKGTSTSLSKLAASRKDDKTED